MRGSRIPKYRRRRLPQGERAFVTLTDAATGARHDFNLGPYGSPESRARYARLLAEWERAGRRLPGQLHAAARSAPGPTVAGLCRAYWRAIEPRVSAGHAAHVKATLRLLRQLFGEIPATEFRPSMLRTVRAASVTGDLEATPRRRPWSRRTANRGARQIAAMFRWGVSQELVPASVPSALATLEPLRPGESAARETSPVGPVPHAVLDAVRPHLSGPIRAMVALQLFQPTGVVGLQAAVLVPPTVEGRLGDAELLADGGDGLAGGQLGVRRAELTNDLFRAVTFACHREPPPPATATPRPGNELS